MAVKQSSFEPLFAKYAGAIPVAYLRALAYKESAFRPDVVHPGSRATGLFQITSVALKDFNQRNATAFKLPQLVDPELNARVATDHLRMVMGVYARQPSLRPDWSSRRWVELLTLGWNAGHNAVARFAQRLESSGVPVDRVTVDTVSALAPSGGMGKYIADKKRVAWAKSVAALFLGSKTAPTAVPGPFQAGMIAAPGSGTTAILFGLAALGALVLAVGKGEGRR